MKISAVLPVHSEIDSLRPVVEELVRYLGGDLHEIVFIVSPRSPEATLGILREICAERPFARVEIQRENPGLGRAVRQGLAAITGTHVLMIDSDGEMDTSTTADMVAVMKRTGCQMVVGSRWMKGGGAQGYDPLKLVLNHGFQIIFGMLFGTRIHDLTFGFKLIRRADLDGIVWNSTLHEIAAETTLRPLRRGCHVEEVPTVWRQRRSGVSKNTFLRNFRYVSKALEILFAGRARAG